MSTNVKDLASDFVRAGTIAAAVLVVFINAAPSLNVPASWVVYASVAVGIVNSLVGLAKPYAAKTVAAIRGK